MATLTLMLMLPVNAQQTSPSPISNRSAPANDCRFEYQQAMQALDRMIARLDAADRSHDKWAIRAAVFDARRLLVSVKVKVEACAADTTVVVDPSCRPEVDPKTAPSATYQGKQYLFCSEAEKARFLLDPKRYIRERVR